MKSVRGSGFSILGRILVLCCGLVPLAEAFASASGTTVKQGVPSGVADGAENLCWKSRGQQVVEKTQPYFARRDSLLRQIAKSRRSKLMDAMEKSETARKFVKSQPKLGKPTAMEKAEEKAALEEIGRLENQIGKDSGLQELVARLRTEEWSKDSVIMEILKKDTVCAELDRSMKRRIVSRANHEHQARMAAQSPKPKRIVVKPGHLPGEPK